MTKKDLLRIPILDAFAEGDFCPLCLIWSKDELEYLTYVESNEMTSSGGFRKEVAEAMGFCNRHMHLLYDVAFSSQAEDGLGYATYVRDVIVEFERVIRVIDSSINSERRRGVGRSFIPTGRASRGMVGASEAVRRAIAGATICPICSHLLDSDRRTVRVLLGMLDDDADFAATFGRSAGVCAVHLAAIIDSMGRSRPEKDATVSLIMKVELESLGRMHNLLDERIRKYSWEFRNDRVSPDEANSQKFAMNFIGGIEGLHCKTRKTLQYSDSDL